MLRVLFPISLVSVILSMTPASGQVLVGPVAGGGVSWVSFHEKESRQLYKQVPVPSFMGGIGLSFQVRKNFYMHTAALYSRKGENLSSSVDPNLKHKEIYHFIDVPIVFAREFKINLGHNKIVKWYAGIGPNIGYWLNGKGSVINNQLLEDGFGQMDYKIEFKGSDNPDPSRVYITDANRFQLGLNLATGWVFEPVGLQKIYFNVRYELGHTYISKGGMETFTGINDYHGDMKARNMGLRISVSYLVDLKPSEKKKGKSVDSSGKKIKRR
ncbi:MAG: outer membrane beta-barrel protein [Bacteroidetes bacterium]|nr:outer membrane beta-barrel protein [Bacteroidota bacterium]